MSQKFYAEIYVTNGTRKRAAIIESLRQSSGTSMFKAVSLSEPGEKDLMLIVSQEVGLAHPRAEAIYRSPDNLSRAMVTAVRRVMPGSDPYVRVVNMDKHGVGATRH